MANTAYFLSISLQTKLDNDFDPWHVRYPQRCALHPGISALGVEVKVSVRDSHAAQALHNVITLWDVVLPLGIETAFNRELMRPVDLWTPVRDDRHDVTSSEVRGYHSILQAVQ